MAFMDGKQKSPMSGGNRERESFGKKVSSMSSSKMGGEKPKSPMMGEGGGSKTSIEHHPDGSHTVTHHDGEVSEHPNHGHMAAHLHAKHAGGEVGNMHAHEGGATTHHVGPDGSVQGPMEHGSPQEGADHMASMMSDGPENETSSVEGMGSTEAPEGYGGL